MTTSAHRRRPVVLCILDGWGLREDAPDNALTHARLPHWRRFLREYPHAAIATSGRAVGLPHGQMGNSEVGHMNIGAGRIAVPELPRIDQAIEDQSFYTMPALTDALKAVKAAGGRLHVLGLLSPGGVHSHQDHLLALARAGAAQGVDVFIHAFTDGRDTPPQSAAEFIASFEHSLAALPQARVATLGGRFYGMDRDKRWERIAQAHAALVEAQGARAPSAQAAVAQAYAQGQTDEFIAPTVIGDYAGMRDGDGIIMANFRADRARQILGALLDPAFDGFARARRVEFSARLGMVSYSDHLDGLMGVLFPPAHYPNTLGEVIAQRGLQQLRIAETEKYAHVTFFLNGGRDEPFAGEERILVPSPKVATYDLKPEMSAATVTDHLTAAIAGGGFDLIVVNYANPDMVGHTGVMAAAVQAAEAVDACLGRLEDAVKAAGGWLLITADHGNLEQMSDPASGQPHTQHTTGPVPIVLAGEGAAGLTLKDGKLADIAPTLLVLLGIAQPADMTGEPLVAPVERKAYA